MKNVIIILDPAHGENVKGKCSPNHIHREYKWSRDRVANIKTLLLARGYEVYQTTTSINEPGLSVRKNYATQICHGKRKLLLSLHNNAKGSDGKWHDAQGVSIFTTKGITKSDYCARIILNRFEKDFPEIKIRRYMKSTLNEDFEENFTVLTGADYMACLIEWLFQDNMEDYEKLKSAEFNSRFETSLVEAIEEINDYFSK